MTRNDVDLSMGLQQLLTEKKKSALVGMNSLSDSSGNATTAKTVAASHDIHLRHIVQDKILMKMVKHVTQLTRGWVVLVVDDRTTRILSYAVRMSDLTDCGVSIIERLELNRQPFPEMNVVYFIAPTTEAIRKTAADFANESKPKYNDVYLFLLSHATDDVLAELKNHPALVQRLKALQEVNADFLALEKCAFSFDMNSAFHHMYSPVSAKSDAAQVMAQISEKLVSVCATLEEYPYVRYKADQPRMEQLAQMFQMKMNAFVANNDAFVYAPQRGTLLFMDRSQDIVSPLLHESTFQAMIYDLLDVNEEQITYPAETNAGVVMKTAFLNENDKLWIEFRHTHIAKVSEEIGTRMATLSSSKAGSSLGKGKSTDLHSMAAALRELPEYRELLGRLSQHLHLAGKAMEVFTSTCLLDASNLEQSMATGVDDSGKKLKSSAVTKQFEDLMKDPKLTESDRFRIVAVFALTQDTMKDTEKNKTMQAACLSKKYDTALLNLRHVAGPALYKQNGNSALSAEELKEATKRATAAEYSNARYDPKIKAVVEKALKGSLDETEYSYIITPPPQTASGNDDAKKKNAPISLRKLTLMRTLSLEQETAGEDWENRQCGGQRRRVLWREADCVRRWWMRVLRGKRYSLEQLESATYHSLRTNPLLHKLPQQLRSIYEVRAAEKRDVILGTTSFLKPNAFIDALANLQELQPLAPPAVVCVLLWTDAYDFFVCACSGHGAEVAPLSSGEIHVHMEQQQPQSQQPEKTSSSA
ncbi:Syntaxin-binding protein, partial [Globisporangium splendens]